MTVPEIQPKDVNKEKQRLIDVRTPDEYTGELGRVPGSELFTMGEDLVIALEKADKSEQIVFICRSGNRSGQVTSYALSKGFSQVYNMTGGMILWNELGLPVEKGGQK